jgi:hypothetical protein
MGLLVDARAEGAVLTGPDGTLASPLPVTAMAMATVAAAGIAAADLAAARFSVRPPVRIDSRDVATAFTSERHLKVNGSGGPTFARLSRFFQAQDGWVRLHANYPHHRNALLTALKVSETREDTLIAAVAEAIAQRRATDIEDLVVAHGGLAAALRTPAQWLAHPAGAAASHLPLCRVTPLAPGPPFAARSSGLPAAGVRVLDLTRVIAGPVAGRTLALLGADVLRVDSPRLPELLPQHLDTGMGKNSTLLDLAQRSDRATFDELLTSADVVLTGYRHDAMLRLGLSPRELASSRPGLVVATLTAWGTDGPWADRRGFDSLVQVATGIASITGEDGRPGQLPAQALDHGTGYLMAAAVLRSLAERVRGVAEGWHAELALAGTAAWLLRADRPTEVPDNPVIEPDLIRRGELTYARPPLLFAGGPVDWAHPAVEWGSSPAHWLQP